MPGASSACSEASDLRPTQGGCTRGVRPVLGADGSHLPNLQRKKLRLWVLWGARDSNQAWVGPRPMPFPPLLSACPTHPGPGGATLTLMALTSVPQRVCALLWHQED